MMLEHRKALWRRELLGVIVLLATAASCGSEEPAQEVGVGQEPGPLAFEEPGRSRWGEPEIKVVTGISDGRLMIGGDFAVVDEATWRIRDDVVIVDLETGAQTELPTPTADVPIAVRSITADGSGGFVVTGGPCANGDGIRIEEDEQCLPGNDVPFHLPADDDTWREVPFPDEISPRDTDQPWSSSPRLGTIPGGGAYALVQSSPVPTTDEPHQYLAVLEDDTWRVVLQTPGVNEVCATSEAFFALTRGSADVDAAGVQLLTGPIAGGDAVDVALPEGVHGQMDGVGVHLGCTADAAHVTSPAPDGHGRPQLYSLRGGSWSEQAFARDRDVPEPVTSSTEGLFVRTFDGESFHAFLFGADGAVREEPAARASEVYPDGDRAFIVGPAPGLAAIQADVDEPSVPADPTISVVPLPTR